MERTKGKVEIHLPLEMKHEPNLLDIYQLWDSKGRTVAQYVQHDDAVFILNKTNAFEPGGIVAKLVEPLLRYESCLMAYAAESARKGNRDNQKFWEQRVKTIVALRQELDQALAAHKEIKEKPPGE